MREQILPPRSISPPPQRQQVLTGTTVIRSIEVGLMARVDLFAKIPLIGMSLVFLAMFIVAVTAYLHIGWYSIIGYAIAAVTAVAGFVMTFRDIRDTPGPEEHWDVKGTPIDPASPQS
jgi:energy-converting hydrogenase Eha subunit C